MPLAMLDWLIIISYFLTALAIGLIMRKRAGKSLAEFFVAGRSLPWWLAGTSMVATTFAADTPLAVTGLTIQHGIAGNWFWWAMALGGMVTVFVYSRLWRRSGVVTDVELVEMRYGGKPASFLRGFRAVYFSLLINAIIIGWVTGAMMMVLQHTVLYGVEFEGFLGRNLDAVLIISMLAITGFYCALSGIWGVTLTDFLQFFLAIIGSVMLAVVAVNSLGGMEMLRAGVEEIDTTGSALSFLPWFTGGESPMPLDVFFILLLVMWWASWYPGAEPGGGGYVVQRMASCRSERDSLLAALWFQVAHYCVRPWPWLLVALVAYVSYPQLHGASNAGVGFPMVIRDMAPVGLRGLLLVTFFAAFMSTISTQVNWGASYLVNDFYKRFMAPNASDRQLAWAGRWATVLVLVVGGTVAFGMRGMSVDAAWKMMAALGAGTGAVYMLRWFWWRINAWSEISAMVASLFFYLAFSFLLGGEGRFFQMEERLLALVALCTMATWLLVTFLTQPEREERLLEFYRRVSPVAWGWGPIAAKASDVKSPDRMIPALVSAFLGAAIVYSVLPATGFLLFGDYLKALVAIVVAVVCGVVLWHVGIRPARAAEEESPTA